MRAAEPSLSVGSRVAQFMFSLLVIGLSLASGLVALVPIVLRDAHGSELAGKSSYCFFLNLTH